MRPGVETEDRGAACRWHAPRHWRSPPPQVPASPRPAPFDGGSFGRLINSTVTRGTSGIRHDRIIRPVARLDAVLVRETHLLVERPTHCGLDDAALDLVAQPVRIDDQPGIRPPLQTCVARAPCFASRGRPRHRRSRRRKSQGSCIWQSRCRGPVQDCPSRRPSSPPSMQPSRALPWRAGPSDARGGTQPDRPSPKPPSHP